MAVSVFDLFKIGIGPSSSHTVGPMRAACLFARAIERNNLLERVTRLKLELFGSLGHTGRGHGTDKAVLLGLEGQMPDAVDPDHIGQRIVEIFSSGRISLLGKREMAVDLRRDMTFHKRQTLPYHSNGMRFAALDDDDQLLLKREYYSVGGGFVVNPDE